LLRIEALRQLRECDYIIHAGDIGRETILESLQSIATVVAVRGNMDFEEWTEKLPDRELIDIEGIGIYVIHNGEQIDLDPAAAEVKVVVSGHSHRPSIEERGGVLYVNPGSAGPRRFTLPVSMALLTIDEGHCEAQIERLL
jgi:hypothetical protein